MNQDIFYGATENQDLNPALKWRDTRPLSYKIRSILTDSSGEIVASLGLLMIVVSILKQFPLLVPDQVALFSLIPDLIMIFTFITIILSWNKKRKHPFRDPITIKNNIKSGDGIIVFGKDRQTGNNIWFSNDDLRTHVLVFGSTGSGKSRFLLGILYQSLLFGSGVMYVDGKADNTVFWLVYSLCRRVGREDDLLVLNYLTSGERNSSIKTRNLERLSNTTNPFATGNSDELRSLIVGLMSSEGGGDMWQDRASAMVKALLGCLTYKRDRGDFNLDIRKIRQHMTLDAFLELLNEDGLPEEATDDILRYLLELPGFNMDDANLGEVSPKAQEQHGFLQMQLTGVLTDLSSTYKHLFDVPLGEICYKDTVFNRRILFCMLPSLEKDPSALAGLGRLVVAGVRSALAPALGSGVEGRLENVIKQKPTNSDVPFVLILDEYGYYAVKGFAVVAAQARSLGVSVFFAGQDFPSFAKSDKNEAESTIANTNIKVCLKLEDQDQTYRIVKDRGGQQIREEVSGSEIAGFGFHDQTNTRINRVDRVDLRDLVNQKAGQAHIMYGDKLVRSNLVYIDPHESPYAKLNKFLMIEGPKKEVLDRITNSENQIKKLFKGDVYAENINKAKKEASTISFGLKQLLSNIKKAKAKKLSATSVMEHSIGCLDLSAKIVDELLLKKALETNNVTTNNESSGLIQDTENPMDEVKKAIKQNLVGVLGKRSANNNGNNHNDQHTSNAGSSDVSNPTNFDTDKNDGGVSALPNFDTDNNDGGVSALPNFDTDKNDGGVSALPNFDTDKNDGGVSELPNFDTDNNDGGVSELPNFDTDNNDGGVSELPNFETNKADSKNPTSLPKSSSIMDTIDQITRRQIKNSNSTASQAQKENITVEGQMKEISNIAGSKSITEMKNQIDSTIGYPAEDYKISTTAKDIESALTFIHVDSNID